MGISVSRTAPNREYKGNKSGQCLDDQRGGSKLRTRNLMRYRGLVPNHPSDHISGGERLLRIAASFVLRTWKLVGIFLFIVLLLGFVSQVWGVVTHVSVSGFLGGFLQGYQKHSVDVLFSGWCSAEVKVGSGIHTFGFERYIP